VWIDVPRSESKKFVVPLKEGNKINEKKEVETSIGYKK